MKRGDLAELKVKKILLSGYVQDNMIYTCKVLNFNEKEECLYLLLEDNELEEVSLDCIYECKVKSQDCITSFTGRIKERYIGYEGKKIKLQVENGFYKINLKSVDKQIV